MTVKEYAALHGIGDAAIYNRLKRKGLKISDFTADGQLTDAGLELLEKWYNFSRGPVEKDQQYNTQHKTIHAKSNVERLTEERDAALAKVDHLEHRIEELTDKFLTLMAAEKKEKMALAGQVAELTARLSAPAEPVMVADDPPAEDQPQEQPTVATDPPAGADDQARTVTTTPDEGADQEQPTAQEETTDQATAADDSEVNEQQVVTPTRRSFRQWLADKILGKP